MRYALALAAALALTATASAQPCPGGVCPLPRSFVSPQFGVRIPGGVTVTRASASTVTRERRFTPIRRVFLLARR